MSAIILPLIGAFDNRNLTSALLVLFFYPIFLGLCLATSYTIVDIIDKIYKD